MVNKEIGFEFNINNNIIEWLAKYQECFGLGYIHQQALKLHIFGLQFAIGFSQFKPCMIGIETLPKLVRRCNVF